MAKGRARPCRLWTPYERKKPGRFDEQPMPETTSSSCGWISSSAQACNKAFSTPKSPQPGHQSGGTSRFEVIQRQRASCGAVTVAMCSSPQGCSDASSG